ncbi:acyl-CoA thioesterase, partial [Enterococcus faecalis]
MIAMTTRDQEIQRRTELSVT